MTDPAPRLTKRQALKNLRSILVGLFVETDDVRMVAEDADLDSAQIDFNGAPIRMWTAVLAQAAREDKVAQVAAAAADHYAEQRQQLMDAAVAYSNARPDPPNWPRWLLAAAGVVALVGVVAYWRIFLPPEPIKPMSDFGKFNLAVARFPVVDTDGNERDDCVAALVNQLIEETVHQSADDEQEDIMTDFRGPAEIGVADELRASQLAEEIKATVVVYGVITATDPGYAFQPAFYVRNTARGFDYGGELAGPNQLGKPIGFELPSQVDCSALTDEDLDGIDLALSDRLAVLGTTIKGLGHFFQEDYEGAAYNFGVAARQNEQEQDTAGLAVAEMLLGATRLRQAKPGDPENQGNRLAEAERAFNRTVEQDPDYSRAYLGLGITALERAKVYDQLGVEVLDVAPAYLMTATQAFSIALAAADQPQSAFVPAKAALGMGIAHWLGAKYDKPGWSVTAAITQFNAVTATLAVNGAAGIKPVAALAYGYLGVVAQYNGDWEAMKNNCQRTILLLAQSGAQPDARTTAEAWGCIAIADRELGNHCDAVTDYESALQIGSRERDGTTAIPAAKLEQWRASMNDMRTQCNEGS